MGWQEPHSITTDLPSREQKRVRLDVPPHDDWSIDDDSLDAPTDDSLEAPTSSQEQKRVRLDVPPHDGWSVGDDSLEAPYYRLECEVRPSRA